MPTRTDTTTHGDEHAWVLAEPVRAHLVRLLSDTGLPWRAVAIAAGVPSPCVCRLLHGRHGRRVRRLRAVDAARLLALSPARLEELALRFVPAWRPRSAALHLIGRGVPTHTLRRWSGADAREVGLLLGAGDSWCRASVAVRVMAAAEAHGWCVPDRVITGVERAAA